MDDSDDNFSAFEKNTIYAKNNASIFYKIGPWRGRVVTVIAFYYSDDPSSNPVVVYLQNGWKGRK